jgi:hypothetical protein
MPLDSVKKLDAFVKSGGILVATGRQPSVIPGFQTTETEQNRAQADRCSSLQRLESECEICRQGEELGPVLTSLLQPDALITPSGKDFGVVHRKTKDADVYFVANTSNQTRKVGIAFRASGEPEIWDAITGRSTRAKDDEYERLSERDRPELRALSFIRCGIFQKEFVSGPG